MAIFHFTVTQTKRSKGQSAIASAAYRAGERLYSEYYGEYSDYTRKGGVICSDILLPPHAPKEYADRQTLWNAVEKAERGKTAQLAYSFEISLQNEFSLEENIALARKFLLEQFVSRGMTVDVSFHEKEHEDGGTPNPHFHFLCPIRPIEQDGTWGLKPADFEAFLRLMEESGFAVKHCRGGVISFLAPGQEKPTRLRASTLGEGFDPADIRDVIAGKRPIPEIPHEAPAPRKVSLVIDIQERLRSGKGPAYERWAKVYNLKQMAATLQYLQEHGIADYDELAAGADAAVDRSHRLATELQTVERSLAQTSELMGAVVDYAKTRPVFDGYKASKYNKKYLTQHEDELATYRAARATMKEILDGGRLPRIDELKEKRRQLAAQKKALYMEYRQAQNAMREAVTVKANIDRLLGLTDERTNKEQER